jgi:hypothetical protein
MILEKRLKANISINTSGDNAVIAAPGAGKYIVIDHINFVTAGAVNVQFKDGSTVYGGLYTLTTNQGFVLENIYQDEDGIITLSENAAFNINLSGNVLCGGFIRYRIINQ